MAVNTEKIINRLDFLAPEHASKSKSTKEQAIKAAISQRINRSLWARHGKLTDGAAYLAAHLLTKRDQRSGNNPLNSSSVQGQGPVESIREGEIEIEWTNDVLSGGSDNSKDSDSALMGTDYGQAFVNIKNNLLSTPEVDG